MSPDYINFSAPTKSTKKEGQKNQEGLLPKKRIAIFKYKTLKKVFRYHLPPT
jgi:hypothetical protein